MDTIIPTPAELNEIQQKENLTQVEYHTRKIVDQIKKEYTKDHTVVYYTEFVSKVVFELLRSRFLERGWALAWISEPRDGDYISITPVSANATYSRTW